MKTAIFGAGQRAGEIKRLLCEENIATDYFIVDKEYMNSASFDDTKIISTDDFLKSFNPNEVKLFIGVGMPKMNRVRERIFSTFHSYGFHFETYISKYANVLTDKVGEGNTVFAGVNIGPGVEIGDGNHFEMGVTISHDCIIGNYNFFAPGCTLCGDIKIGKGSFFGANCTVRNSVSIGDYTLVGAAAYVSENTNDFDVVLPARSVKLKDKNSVYFMEE